MKLKKLCANIALLLTIFSLSSCGPKLPNVRDCVVISAGTIIFCVDSHEQSEEVSFPPSVRWFCLSPRHAERVENFLIDLLRAHERKSCAPKYPPVDLCVTDAAGLFCESGLKTLAESNKYKCLSPREDEILKDWIIEIKKGLVDC